MRQACEELKGISLDLQELFSRVEYDRELLEDIFEIFKSEFPKLQQSLSAAIDRGDKEEIQTGAHTLKGMLASLSFHSASIAAMHIERLAQSADLIGIPTEMLRMEYEARASQADLENFCARVAW